MGLVHRGWAFDTERYTSIPAILKTKGYETHLFGIQHEHYDTRALGYDENHECDASRCESVTDAAVAWLNNYENTTPFFTSIGFFDVHRRGLDPSTFARDAFESYDVKDVTIPPYLPDLPEVRKELADFYGNVRFMDTQIARIIDALEAHLERTNDPFKDTVCTVPIPARGHIDIVGPGRGEA